jgi:hypothetical protein
MSSRQTDRGDPLRPFLAFLEGKPVAYLEMVGAGRRLAQGLVSRGTSSSCVERVSGSVCGTWSG